MAQIELQMAQMKKETTQIKTLLNGHHIHFMGVGGIGMSGLACILRERGFQISGCDVNLTQPPAALRDRGIRLSSPHHPSHLTDEVGLVVFSSAVSGQEPELMAARARGIPTISRGELLAELTSTKSLVAVAGAHGKTTTSGMSAQLLIHAGWDPTAVIGGHVVSIGGNARHGRGRYVVAETDESDGSFLLLHPQVAIVTNIDREHLNYYQTFENLIAAFKQFVRQLGSSGTLIRCADDPVVRRALRHPRQLSYGIDHPADIRATRLRCADGGSEFLASYRHRALGTFRLRVPGRHNVLNALGVIGLGLTLELPLAVMREALWNFQGTLRRYQVLELPHHIRLVEDYAHHPSEVRTTLAVEASTSHHRVAVFQPHRFSRTQALEGELTNCFDEADGVIVTDVYSAFEPPIPGISGARLAQRIKAHGHPCVRYVPRGELPRFLASFIQPHDTVFFLGAGDIGQVCHDVAQRLRTTNGTPR
ncbi:MAG: UDP-N-acetylmuramate--L-alanine ligase [Candidatus Omnitrophica bacterium]|nr:UDP-N-acetylmuramate--L-alanine ligase [Candidatus Omnitrophota bacterium]